MSLLSTYYHVSARLCSKAVSPAALHEKGLVTGLSFCTATFTVAPG